MSFESDQQIDYMAGPVTEERRAWWREAARQMDEMRAQIDRLASAPRGPDKA